MSEMIERVARAIAASGHDCRHAVTRCPSETCECRRDARAAIEAMLEPTEAMIEAAGSEHAAVPPREAWRDMISEVLR